MSSIKSNDIIESKSKCSISQPCVNQTHNKNELNTNSKKRKYSSCDNVETDKFKSREDNDRIDTQTEQSCAALSQDEEQKKKEFDIDKLSLRSLANKIKEREISCVDVVKHFIKIIEEKQDNLHAFIYFNKDEVLENAIILDKEISEKHIRGRLHGVPLVIKDTIHIKGIPNTAGTPTLKNFIPQDDANIIKILRKEGAIFIGKTNMNELSFGSTSENPYFGNVRNAHNDKYSPFGSSGGNATAIGAGMAVAGVGADTVGSITLPSSGNGICGLRPTWNRYSLKGVTPMAKNLDTIGPMGIQIDDLIYLDEIMNQRENIENCYTLKGLRIGVPSNTLCASVHEDIKEVFETLKDKLIKADVELINIDITELFHLADKYRKKSLLNEPYLNLENYLKEYNTNINIDKLIDGIQSPYTKAFFEKSKNRNFYKAKWKNHSFSNGKDNNEIEKRYQKLFENNGLKAIIFPTTPILPISFDEIEKPGISYNCIRNVQVSSAVGAPLTSMPMGKSKNDLPIGLAVGGEINGDAYLLRVCSLIEETLGSDQRNTYEKYNSYKTPSKSDNKSEEDFDKRVNFIHSKNSSNNESDKFNPKLVIKKYKCRKEDGSYITVNVIRDDHLIGGSKQRAAFKFIQTRNEKEFVYAGPSTGFAQLALAYACKEANKKFTSLLQGRDNEVVRKTREYKANVNFCQCTLEDLQQQARDYVNNTKDAFLCPFGLDCEEYKKLFKESIIQSIPEGFLPPDRIWLPIGSGTLLRTLAELWKNTIFMPVRVGKKFWQDQFEPSVWDRLGDGIDLELIASKQKFFEKVPENLRPPYPSVATYDAKVWQFVKQYGKENDWIWNVARDPE